MEADVTVRPGPIEGTGMTIPLEQGRPEEVAAGHAFLLSGDASFTTGVPLPADGGVAAGTGQFAPQG